MVHYKVCYFNGRGRAEGVRFILAQAGVDFEDERITQEDWPKLKSTTIIEFKHLQNSFMVQLERFHAQPNLGCNKTL
uniref:GST N-terminal domain-containing protein n=1 Tax=Romanomermis culicivorax TaxID=13658 RepID=A0A915JHJ5_ROMCU